MSGFECGMCGKVYVGDTKAADCEFDDLRKWRSRAVKALEMTKSMLRELDWESTHLAVLVDELLKTKGRD